MTPQQIQKVTDVKTQVAKSISDLVSLYTELEKSSDSNPDRIDDLDEIMNHLEEAEKAMDVMITRARQ